MRELRTLSHQRGWDSIILFIVRVVVSYAVGYALNAIFGRKNDPRIISPKFQDNETMVRSAVEPHKIVYGKALVSGPLTFAATNGPSNEVLHVVIPLTGHEVEEIGTIYFDDIDSSAPGYNKIEEWNVVPGSLVTEGWFAILKINGIHFLTSAGSDSRIKMGTQIVSLLHTGITTAPGYSSENYTVSVPSILHLKITGKTLGDTIDVEVVKSSGAYSVWVGPPTNQFQTFEYVFADSAQGHNESNQLYLSLGVKANIFDITKHLGAPSQVADSSLVAENLGWTTDHRLRGRAYIYCKLKYYADRWPTGIPILKAEVKGRKVYDPRSDLTVWSDNPALCIRDYLISSFGLDADNAEIDDTSFIAAANICDEWVLSATPVQILESAINTSIDTFIIHTGPTTGGSLGHNLRTGDSVEIVGHSGSIPSLNGVHESITRIDDTTLSIFVSTPTGIIGGTGGTIQLRQRRYRCDGVITLGERPIDVVQRMLTCCDATLVYTEGTYKLYVGAYTSSVGNLNESHLRGPIQVIAKQPRKSLFNGVRGTFRDKSRYWQETDFPAYRNSTYATQDGGEEILRDITLPFTTDTYQAQRLAKLMLEKSRQGVLVSFPAKLSAFKYAVNDVVQVSISHLGWTNKEFRILSWSLADFGVNIQMQEESSGSYAWNNGDETSVDTAPDTNLPSAFEVSQPTGVTAIEQLYQGLNTAGFRSRIKVSWTAAADTNVIGYVVYWRVYADTVEAENNWHDGQSQLIPGTSFNLEDVPLGTFFITLKAFNNLGFYSLETAAIKVVVLGKTAPPADVTGFSVGQNGDVVVFTWSTVADIDLKGYEVRYGPRATMTWDSGVVVTQAERGTEVTTALIPPGDWKFCIKAQDTSGIYSVNETCRDLEITQSRTIIQTLVEDPDFLGTKSNFVHHWTGALVPDSQDLASVDSWDTFDQFVPNAYTTCLYTPKNDIDIGFVDDVRAWADISAAMGPGEVTGSPQPFTEIDYHSGAGFDGYEPWTIGLLNARYLRMRLGVTSALGKCYVSRYRVNADVAEQTESASGVVIAASGTVIVFANQFHSAPSIQITVQGSVALTPTYTNASGVGFTAHVYNNSGVEVGGTINWTATGV